MGITFARQGKHAEAIDAYREAIKFRPDYRRGATTTWAMRLRNVGQVRRVARLLQEGDWS